MWMKRQQVQYWDYAIRWIFNGEYHRDRDLPAIYYFSDGELIVVDYRQHNQLHRATGPAIIHYEKKLKLYYSQGRGYDSLEEMQMVEACR